MVGGADTAPAQETSPASTAEGATRTFSGTLKFSTIGGHPIRALATLQAKDGLQLTKTLPAETSAANPAGNVVIVGERLIDADLETTCEVWNVQGGKARFTVRVDDMGTGLTFAWTVTGATVLSGANSNLLEVQLPAQAGIAVTLGVTVKRPDGGLSSGSMTFKTITNLAADLEYAACQLSHVLTQGSFQTNPGDPGPDGGLVINPGDIAQLAAVAAQLSNAANAAAKSGGTLTLSSTAPLLLQPVSATVATIGTPAAATRAIPG